MERKEKKTINWLKNCMRVEMNTLPVFERLRLGLPEPYANSKLNPNAQEFKMRK